jgi:hypothetical protein
VDLHRFSLVVIASQVVVFFDVLVAGIVRQSSHLLGSSLHF